MIMHIVVSSSQHSESKSLIAADATAAAATAVVIVIVVPAAQISTNALYGNLMNWTLAAEKKYPKKFDETA